MNPQPHRLAPPAARLGEGPLWHPEEERLYWVDIDGHRLNRCRVDGSSAETVLAAGPIGGFTFQADGRLVLLMEGGAIRLLDRGQLREGRGVHPLLQGTRWNDALSDPAGRIFTGSIAAGPTEGIFARIDLDGTIHRLREGIGCSNGMGFSLDGRTLYHTDSVAGVIRAYAYDVSTGNVESERIFAQFAPAEGYPDGLAVDAEGYIWSAFWDGYCLRRLDPDGRVVLKIDFPVARVSSVTFGGPNGTDMFVTTARGDDPAKDHPDAGALFHLNCGLRGRPLYRSRLQLD